MENKENEKRSTENRNLVIRSDLKASSESLK